MRGLRAGVVVVGAGWGFAGEAACGVPASGPAPQEAFATIGGERYHPFYARVIAPHAVAARGVVYCAFQDSGGRPTVMAYDPAGRKWSGPVTASEFGLGKDHHGNPSLYVDRKGFLHLFHGCHGGAMRHTRSAAPYDVAQWRQQASPAPKATYPQSMRLADGRAYLFYRAGGHPEPWCMRTSADDCATFGAAQRIIEMRVKPRHRQAAAYAHFFPGRDGKGIHCFWNYKEDDPRRWPAQYRGLHEAVYRFNVYYIRRDAEGTWRSAAGEAVSLPVSKADADAKCMVYDSGEWFAYPGQHALGPDDRPFARISTGVRDWGSEKVLVPIESRYACRAGGTWQVTDRMPGDWPADVAGVVGGAGEAAFEDLGEAGTRVRQAEPWFIFFRHRPKPTALYLYGGGSCATRAGGPAACE